MFLAYQWVCLSGSNMCPQPLPTWFCSIRSQISASLTSLPALSQLTAADFPPFGPVRTCGVAPQHQPSHYPANTTDTDTGEYKYYYNNTTTLK